MAVAIRPRDVALIVLLASVWGTAFMFISVGLESFSPILFAALRFDLAAVFLIMVALARSRHALLPRNTAEWASVLVAGLLMAGAYHAFLFWGQARTTESIAAVIVGLSPVLTTVFSRALLTDERVGRRGLLGLAVGFLGVVLLAVFKGGSLLDARGRGELAVVAAIAAFALGSVLVKRTGAHMDLFAFTAWQAIVGAVALHATAFWLEGWGRAEWTQGSIGALVYLAIISSGLGFLLYFRLNQMVGPIRVNLVSYIAPIFATASGILVLDTAFEWRALAAFALVCTGFWLVVRPAPSKSPQGPPLDAEEARRVGP